MNSQDHMEIGPQFLIQETVEAFTITLLLAQDILKYCLKRLPSSSGSIKVILPHCCGVEFHSDHTEDKPSYSALWGVRWFTPGTVFCPPTRLTWLKMDEIILKGLKT